MMRTIGFIHSPGLWDAVKKTFFSPMVLNGFWPVCKGNDNFFALNIQVLYSCCKYGQYLRMYSKK